MTGGADFSGQPDFAEEGPTGIDRRVPHARQDRRQDAEVGGGDDGPFSGPLLAGDVEDIAAAYPGNPSSEIIGTLAQVADRARNTRAYTRDDPALRDAAFTVE